MGLCTLTTTLATESNSLTLSLLVFSEKAVYSTNAHVFQIDPETKKKWLPSSTSAVRVAFYHDASRKTYRIIAIENNKVHTRTHTTGGGKLHV